MEKSYLTPRIKGSKKRKKHFSWRIRKRTRGGIFIRPRNSYGRYDKFFFSKFH